MLNQRAECQMRRIVVILFVLSLLAVTAVIAKGQNHDPYAHFRAICQLNMGGGQGSGTLIAKSRYGHGLVLTCRHVAEQVGNQTEAVFVWAGGMSSKGRVIAVQGGNNFNSDLALVEIFPVPVGVRPVRVVRFNQLHGPWVGAGFRSGWMRITPPIRYAREFPDGAIIFGSPLVKGMSGGSLFNNRGEIVAVTVGSDFVAEGIGADGVYLHSLIARFAR